MIFRILFWTAFSLAPFWTGFAQGFDSTVKLGDRYFDADQISEALYSYQRAVFYSQSEADGELLLKIAECFEKEGNFENAIEYYDHAFFAESSDSLKLEILFKKANSFIKSGNFHFAIIEMLGLNLEPESINEKRKHLFLASSYYGLQDYKNAEKYFSKSIPADNIQAHRDIEEIFQRKGNFYKPNPTTALWLSVFVPGLGQFYSGDWSAGINSFLLTSSLLTLTFYLTKIYHPIDAILTALPWFQRYYQGGFGQAQKIAEKRRDRRRDITFQQIASIIRSANHE